MLPVLGSATDDWSGVTWSSGDFSDGNFRLETRFNDPDSNCDSSAVANLDHLQVRVHYTVPANPTQATIDAANVAKSPGGPDNVPISIFSIHYDDSGTSGQALMQTISSPSTLPIASITTATRSGSTATITTSQPHKFVKNQRVIVSGVTGCSQFNGTFMITSTPTPNQFRYTVPSSGCSSGSGGTGTPTNLFIAPGSSDMQGIFQSIGTQVCPAASPQCSNGIDDDSDGGLIDEFDPSCHTDGNAANAASYDPLDPDEWETPGVPVPPSPPPPPPSIELGSWQQVP